MIFAKTAGVKIFIGLRLGALKESCFRLRAGTEVSGFVKSLLSCGSARECSPRCSRFGGTWGYMLSLLRKVLSTFDKVHKSPDRF